MGHVNAGHAFEQLGRQVPGGTVAGRGIVDLAWVGLDPRNQFSRRARRDAGVDDEHTGQHMRQRNWHKVAIGVVIEFRIEGRIDAAMRAVGTKEQGVAVIRSLGRRFSTNIATRAGPVVHHHLLPKRLAQPERYQPAHGVGRAPCRERHDQPQRFGRIGLGVGRRDQRFWGQCHKTRSHQGFQGSALVHYFHLPVSFRFRFPARQSGRHRHLRHG